MAKNEEYGICAICGEKHRLTFEHVPPKSAFNNKSVIMYSGEELLKNRDPDKLPWESPAKKGKIQQRGRGDYYLCQKCNELTGSWYVPFYSDFVTGIYSAVRAVDLETAKTVIIHSEHFRPLPIYKEIMVMFCDINRSTMNDTELRTFLMDKSNNDSFKTKKYRVFCYIAKGAVVKSNPISAHIMSAFDDPIILLISEIISHPLGLALYIDLPDSYTPQGTEITAFSQYNYDDVVNGEFALPVLESNTFFSADYRSKEEIINTMCENEVIKQSDK